MITMEVDGGGGSDGVGNAGDISQNHGKDHGSGDDSGEAGEPRMSPLPMLMIRVM